VNLKPELQWHIGHCQNCNTSGLHVNTPRGLCQDCLEDEQCTCPDPCEVHEERLEPDVRDRDALYAAICVYCREEHGEIDWENDQHAVTWFLARYYE